VEVLMVLLLAAAANAASCTLSTDDGRIEGLVTLILKGGNLVAKFGKPGDYQVSVRDGTEELASVGVHGWASEKIPIGAATRVRVATADAHCDWAVEGGDLRTIEIVVGTGPPTLNGPCKVDGGVAMVDFQSPSAVAEDEAKHAAAEVRPPAPTPAGGRVLVDLRMPMIELADQHTWIVVVQRPDGSEAARYDRAPDPRGVGWHVDGEGLTTPPSWRNLLVVDVPDASPAPLHVRLANRATASTCDWSVE
jgi:hypothetical protein